MRKHTYHDQEGESLEMKPLMKVLDGNEAAARIAYKLSEVCAIYPITPSSTMGELADAWAAEGKKNLWGAVPHVAEMQSEAGAIGAVHGALQTGALTTTFTASQGLLLMIPNLYKIAGELTSAVFHVAARSLATHALSIFGDHADIMAVRSTGFGLLASASVQEAQDLALVAHAATLEARVPFLHFFDGFRTSHELGKIELVDDAVIHQMIDDELVFAHRERALRPEKPVIRGTAQNPDVFFQSREACSPYYRATPRIVLKYMERFEQLTGRRYRLFDYFGDPEAERVIVVMGSGAETVRETVDRLVSRGERVGVLQVRLFRPFSARHFLNVLPATVRRIAVLDRTKEPGAPGEPLYLDVVTTLSQAVAEGDDRPMPLVIGGRYGLSSKDFTPAMVKAVYDELDVVKPKKEFTVGIVDDVSHTSLEFDTNFRILPKDVRQALFFGLGADGTVGANHNTIKIIGEETDLFAQGYFVYDSKKSGSQTVSHLRFGPRPICAPYLVDAADFIGVHQFQFINRPELLDSAADGATLLINAPYPSAQVWDKLPRGIQERIISKRIKLYAIDAYRVARETGMGARINTIMQTCFFALSDVIPAEEAIEKIKQAIRKTYGKKGDEVVRKNCSAVDQTLENLHRIEYAGEVSSSVEAERLRLPESAPEFVKRFTAPVIDGFGESLPVSRMPADGTFPTGTAKYEKRNIAQFVPEWDPEMCIECGNCSLVCPHSCIRTKFYPEDLLENAPDRFKHAKLRGRGFPNHRYTLHISLEDCTGCSLCVDACPVVDKETGDRAINMKEKEPLLETERLNGEFFDTIPYSNRDNINYSTVRGVQFLEPLFEFSGACAGCGETPYLKVLSQLFGDRLLVANATGCSSIYGGNLPTTPWTTNASGCGPAWANSLFEDNAEFGYGYRLRLDQQAEAAGELLCQLAPQLGDELVQSILTAEQATEKQVREQRERIAMLREKLKTIKDWRARHLDTLADGLVKRAVWIVGGDGWAYDIGYGGLDHVLASGRNVNVLVMDTEVYSNTGGQASKSTPLGAVAKFAASGKLTGKKDLAMAAMSYGTVYVARIAMGAAPQQALRAIREAEAYPGASIVIAYSHCIAHGINMGHGLRQQKLAVESGHWPLVRFNPLLKEQGENPLIIDSRRRIPLQEYIYNETRYKMLVRSNPERAKELLAAAQAAVDERWATYAMLAAHYGNGAATEEAAALN